MPQVIVTRRAYAATLLSLPALLLTLAAPVVAEAPERQDCGPSLAFLGAESPEAVLFGHKPSAQKGGSIGEPGALATCTAQCDDGATVSCTGATCNAADRNCPDENGHCEARDEFGRLLEVKYCLPTCPDPCNDSTLCADKDGEPCGFLGPGEEADCTLPSGDCGSCTCFEGYWSCS